MVYPWWLSVYFCWHENQLKYLWIYKIHRLSKNYQNFNKYKIFATTCRKGSSSIFTFTYSSFFLSKYFVYFNEADTVSI